MIGFTDKFYKEMKHFYIEDDTQHRILDHPRHDYVTEFQPDGKLLLFYNKSL